tara:strand:+ start:361 stop:870 length:510 start_codon:yes stop_codon:yes gene_type:complete
MALKRTSEVITIGASVTESGANTFTEQRIDLQLNPLDNEVLLIYAVDLQPDVPDGAAGTNSSVTAALTSTTQTGLSNISQSSTIAQASLAIRAAGFVDGGVGFESRSMSDTPEASMPYIAIVATNDMFLQILGAGNAGAKTCDAKVYCARAKADSATYAALVQSELLSN